MTNNIADCCDSTSQPSSSTMPNTMEKSITDTGCDRNHENNDHLVQMFDDEYCYDKDLKSPYEPTTTAATTGINLSFSPPPYPSALPSSTTPSSSSPSSHHLSSSTDSLWKILHMIIVVIASATINGVVFGVVNNFGVFYAYLTELSKTDINSLGFNSFGILESADDQTSLASVAYNTDINTNITNNNTNNYATSDALVQSLIAGVGSFNVGLIFFCSIFASVLSDRYGIRSICFIGGILATIGMYASSVSLNLIYLYITYGLVLGIGASLVYGPSLAILGHYFTKRLGLVNGLVTAGSSAFSIVMPILLRSLLDLVGIQITFKYLSILMATLILCSLSFKERIKRTAKQNGSAKKNLANMFFYDALWKNNLYLYWVISIPMGLFGYFVPFCHLVKHAREINSYYQGEVLVMSIGITSMIGRLITGPLADFSHVNRICFQQMAFASIGVLTMFLPFVRDFSLLLLCCGLGLFDGCFISLIGPIAFDLVGPEYANQAIGLLLCFCSLPLTTGPPIAAYAYGIYGNYKLAFCIAGIPPIFAALLMFNIIRMQKIQRRRASTVKLSIDEPRLCVLCSKQMSPNGEKLHLLINGNDNNNHYHHDHNTGNIGITKLKLSSSSNEDNNIEKMGLLLNGGSNNIVILPKDSTNQLNKSSKIRT